MKHEAGIKKSVSPLSKKSLKETKIIKAKAVNTAVLKSVEPVSVKEVKLPAAKSAPVSTAQTKKPKAQKTEPKITVDKAPETPSPKTGKVPKVRTAKSSIQTVKVEKTIDKSAVRTGKIIEKAGKLRTVAAAKKDSAFVPQVKSKKAESAKAVQKPSNIKSATIRENTRKPRRTELLDAPAQIEQKSKKSKLPVVEFTSKPRTIKAKPAIVAKSVKADAPQIAVEKIEAVEVETVNPPLPKPRKKKVKPLGAAIFRGKKERYDFQVFPIDGEFEDAAAIYIISSRKVDKSKRAHHKMVCIGQAVSVLSELKKHRKGKCFKQHAANAISVLREENEQKRLKIEADLKSAHAIPCPHA